MRENKLIITIREATSKDANRISKIGTSVFLSSYQYAHDQNDMDIYLKENFSKNKIKEDLLIKTVHYFVAETNGIVVGLVKINTNMWTWRFKGRLTLEVQRLYIPKDMEGKNIGRRLMSAALDAAEKRNYKIIWLSVWENNKKAIIFHRQFGFSIVGDGTFCMGKSKRKYLIMRKK